MSRPRCLRCGATSEWIEGKVPNELAEGSFAAPPLLEDVERALTKINEAEGCFLLGKIVSGKNMLRDGKAILEEVVERWPTSSNDQAQRPALKTEDD